LEIVEPVAYRIPKGVKIVAAKGNGRT
jgi:hypothetical protein